MKKDKWYSEGLNFSCHKCGKCCGGGPGYVWFQRGEIAQIADALKMSREEFIRKYVRRTRDGAFSLIEKENYDCIFFESGVGCSIYDHRPLQCRVYPFWRENIKDKNAWERLGTNCPGIGGNVHFSAEDIIRICQTLSPERER